MQRYVLAALLPLLVSACGDAGGDVASERKALAERFFRGVYACDPSVVDDLAGDDIVVSYPIFEKLFNTSAIRGREAVKDFATGEAVVEKDRVVLVWSFRARNVGSAQPDVAPTNQEHSWGGITLYRFDGEGKIVAEIGEESAPGPVERVGDVVAPE
jgi:hypothetical protein